MANVKRASAAAARTRKVVEAAVAAGGSAARADADAASASSSLKIMAGAFWRTRKRAKTNACVARAVKLFQAPIVRARERAVEGAEALAKGQAASVASAGAKVAELTALHAKIGKELAGAKAEERGARENSRECGKRVSAAMAGKKAAVALQKRLGAMAAKTASAGALDVASAARAVPVAVAKAGKTRAAASAAHAKYLAAATAATGVVDGLPCPLGPETPPMTLRQARAVQALPPHFEFSATATASETGLLFEMHGIDAATHGERVGEAEEARAAAEAAYTAYMEMEVSDEEGAEEGADEGAEAWPSVEAPTFSVEAPALSV